MMGQLCFHHLPPPWTALNPSMLYAVLNDLAKRKIVCILSITVYSLTLMVVFLEAIPQMMERIYR